MFPLRFQDSAVILAFVGVIIAGSAQSGVAGSTSGTLYEALGYGGTTGFNLANLSDATAVSSAPATNIAVGGGTVYFSYANTVYSANANLVGANVVNSSSMVNITALAVNAPAGILYEAFAGGDIAAIDLANPSYAFGFLGQNATSMVVGDGTVYFAEGNTVYSTSSDLHGLNVFATNGSDITALAINESAGILYQAFASGDIAAIDLANPHHAFGFLEQYATSLVADNNTVFFSDGDTVYSTSRYLSGLNIVHENSVPVTGLAINIASVPEPSTLALALGGFAAMAASYAFRRRSENRKNVDKCRSAVCRQHAGSGQGVQC